MEFFEWQRRRTGVYRVQDETLDDLPLNGEHLVMDSQTTFSPEILKLTARTLGLANLFSIHHDKCSLTRNTLDFSGVCF